MAKSIPPGAQAPLRPVSVLVSVLCLCLFAGEAWAAADVIDITHPYAINLKSSVKPFRKKDLVWLDIFADKRLYITRASKDGVDFYRLRLGFFKTKKEALQAYRIVVKKYPKAWVTIVRKSERKISEKYAIALRGKPLPTKPARREKPKSRKPPPAPKAIAKTAPPAPVVKSVAPPAETEPKAAKAKSPAAPQAASPTDRKKRNLIEMDRHALTAGEYEKAIQISMLILERPEESAADKKQALEFLGLARERNGQIAHAKAEYEKYLQLYPQGEDAERVRQRLAGLVTAYKPPTKLASRSEVQDRKKTDRKKKPAAPWRAVGSWSQFYYRDERSIDEEDKVVDLSQIVSTLDFTAKKRTEKNDHRIQITADHDYDFIDGETDYRFTRLYYEIASRTSTTDLKIGRQTHSSGGVLGRFDGINFNVQAVSKVTLNATGGFLLDTENPFDFTRDRKFVSGNIDIGTLANKWNINLYTIMQDVDTISDRKAVGSEVRYFDQNLNIFSLLDYDYSYNALNVFLVNSNWLLSGGNTIFFTIDIRKVPYLSTSNALQGQPVTHISELLELFTEEEIRQLAVDRTATSQTYTVGGSKQLDRLFGDFGQYQVSGDLTVTNLSATPASGGVEGTPATGNEFFLGGQLIGNRLFKAGDTTILGARLGLASTSRDLTLSLNSRYPLANWRFNPLLRYNYRQSRTNSDVRRITRFSVKVDYRYKRLLFFETELGLDWTSEILASLEQKSTSSFFYIGYRWDF